jgi:hypothetical protein
MLLAFVDTSGEIEMNITTVKASYNSASLSAHYKAEDIEEVLCRVDNMVLEKALTRANARQYVIDTMKANGHLPGKPAAELVGHTLLWLACRSDADAEAAAKEGGKVIEYQITGREPTPMFRLTVRDCALSEVFH